jgi:hypothetical protein
MPDSGGAAIGGGAAFLIKDLTLLGGALWTAGESWAAIDRDTIAPARAVSPIGA